MKLFGQQEFSERDLEKICFEWLIGKGLKVKRQARQAFGIDLLIDDFGGVILYELKLSLGDNNSFYSVVGQLLYSKYLIESKLKRGVHKLVVGSLDDVSVEQVFFLSRIGIEHVNLYPVVDQYLRDFNANPTMEKLKRGEDPGVVS